MPSRRKLLGTSILATGALIMLLPQAKVPVQAQAESRVVRIQTMNVYDTLYLLRGGSTSLAMMRDDGVVLVDSQPEGWTDPLRKALESVTDQPVQTIINTHAHRDHVGGNVAIAPKSDIVAHANAQKRMAASDEFKGTNAKFLPNKIVSDKLTLFTGVDQVDLYYFGKGHTDGDLVLFFPEKRVAHFGDLVWPKAVPVVDVESGGSALALPDTLAKAVAQLTDVARVTTGHEEGTAGNKAPAANASTRSARTMPWAEMQEYAEFTRDLVAAARQALEGGKTVDQTAATLQLPARYKAYDLSNARPFVQAMARELGK